MSQSLGFGSHLAISAKVTTIEALLAQIASNQTIVTAMAAAEPKLFFSHVHRRLDELSGVKIYCANPSRDHICFRKRGYSDKVSFNVMFLTSALRSLQGQGYVHYIPQNLSQWAANIKMTNPQIDWFWGTCSKPDANGFVSLGLNNCYESELWRVAKRIVLEINPVMPVTHGDTMVHMDQVDHFLQVEGELPASSVHGSSAEEQLIARYVAELIPDGATIQLGIGGIPNALVEVLGNHKDLGVHTELINDAMMMLAQKGVITGRHKALWPWKMVGAFVFGSRSLYDFVHENPSVELHPASVVNDPYRIGKNHLMHSVNTAVEIDLTGQVCSESVGHKELSGVGGASETHIGAQRSRGGKGIVAISSRAKNGESKIVFELKPGAKVSISRNDVDYVVTEYGCAQLRGRSVAERVRAMIGLAAPEFREDLFLRAKCADYV